MDKEGNMERKIILLSIALGMALAGCAATVSPDLTPDHPVASTATICDPAPSVTPFLPIDPTCTLFQILAPTCTPFPTQMEEPMPTRPPPDPLTITIVYNNIASDPRLTTDWGFGAYIEYHNQAVLFDTGTNGQILLQNMKILEIDPASVQVVILSHAHQDHTGGLSAFLAASTLPPIYLLPSFGASFIQQTRQQTEVIEASPGFVIATDILTTGEVAGAIPEQALVIRTTQGLVVITGCAHPGIVRIIERAIELTSEPVHLVMGGFHLRDSTQAEINAIVSDFRRLGVRRVAPSHCTGDLAIRMFAEEYGQDYIDTGVGSRIIIDN
jgi:7,8-dihydropterin-6-yl-methyl-4-(beta-D-ribofuranosyl)aminobenzene 5'-phosphate synthase